MNTQLIIFDLDGTLVDSIHGIAHSMNLVLQNNGYPLHALTAYKSFVGEGLYKLATKALPLDAQVDDVIMNIYHQMLDVYRIHCNDGLVLYDGIAELLDSLHTKRVKLCIHSNKNQEMVNSIVHALLSPWHFEYAIGAYDQFPTKPSPDAVHYMLHQLKLTNDTCYYVGDSEIDIQTANNSGLKSLSATWGFRTIADLRDANASVLLHHPSDILNYL